MIGNIFVILKKYFYDLITGVTYGGSCELKFRNVRLFLGSI